MGESSLITAALKLLEFYLNLKMIKWYSRIQSGTLNFEKKYRDKSGRSKSYWCHLRLAEEGTPDIAVRQNNGRILWVEGKASKGKLSAEQIEFRDSIDPAHEDYFELRKIDQLDQFINPENKLYLIGK